MPGLNYDPNSIRSTYKDEHLSKHYVKEYFGEGTIGGDEGFYLKDIQDGAGVTIKRGDLANIPNYGQHQNSQPQSLRISFATRRGKK